MTDAVIVSTARTPLCKSWRGALNMTHGATMGGHAVHAAIERARLDPAEVEDVIIGCANPEGATGWNIARQIAIRAGCPVSVPGMTVNRFCSSGLQTIALAAQRIMAGEGEIFVAGGVESISLRAERDEQAPLPGRVAAPPQAGDLLADAADRRVRGEELRDLAREAGRVRRAEPAARGQARAEGKFKDEIVPITTKMKVVDKTHRRRVDRRRSPPREDEGIRADTTYEGVSQIKPAIEGGVHRRRQRQPVLRRRLGLRRDERQGGRTRKA